MSAVELSERKLWTEDITSIRRLVSEITGGREMVHGQKYVMT